ncbi:hypothetical protein VHEMI07378 [[Torrubiella] hemipterigena]|uniref:M protein, serotype 2.1 n=1 Tax=[Torrubiella] hemipterigena TaxID=1531966 RepID=A0A0A1TMW2_9HYPO|nr:hypothetical protein VHEMI07378 [[Torrubiella] hemipterigena]
MSTVAKKPPSTGAARPAGVDASPSRTARTPASSAASTTPNGHTRTRSVRSGTPVSARAAAARRDGAGLGNADADARAEATAAVEDLQQRLEKEERQSEQLQKQIDVLQSKFDDAVKESAKLEEKVHEFEEQVEALNNEKRESSRQIREMETIYEAERGSILKEKEEMANREEEMQAIIQRLKDSLAQRSAEDGDRPSRQLSASPALDGNFAPPSSLNRSDSRSSSKLILQKDKLIESLRLELAEAQIKLVESENQGGGRLQEVERLLMETRMANARLLEDNESYQLLLKERTLKGDLGQNDFSYMSTSVNQDALNALEGKGPSSSLADELSDADAVETARDGDRQVEMELQSMKEQNKALTLYINKIIGRLLQHQDFESILHETGDSKPTTPADPNKEMAIPAINGLLQKAKAMTANTAAGATSSPTKRARPMSIIQTPSSNSAHTDPERAPSIPIGNFNRTNSVRRSRPQSEQIVGGSSLVSQMYRGSDVPASPTIGSQRHSQGFFAPSSVSGGTQSRVPSSGSAAPSSSGNFPGVRSETSSISGDSGEITTPPSQSPPRSQSDKHKTFAGGKPRPLRLVQENPDAVKDNKRASWYTGWTSNWAAKKDDAAPPSSNPIPE